MSEVRIQYAGKRWTEDEVGALLQKLAESFEEIRLQRDRVYGWNAGIVERGVWRGEVGESPFLALAALIGHHIQLQYPAGIPCEHPGCVGHHHHPCEVCGRTGARS